MFFLMANVFLTMSSSPMAQKKSVGIIFPATLVFNTGVPEIMEITAGKCRARVKGETEWKNYEGGQSFSVPGNSSFEIEALELVDYVCHFG